MSMVFMYTCDGCGKTKDSSQPEIWPTGTLYLPEDAPSTFHSWHACSKECVGKAFANHCNGRMIPLGDDDIIARARSL